MTIPGRRAVEQSIGRLAGRWRAQREPPREETSPRLSAAAFRAVIDERLRSLERQLDEVKTRVNGLLFLIAGTVAVQVILRLLR